MHSRFAGFRLSLLALLVLLACALPGSVSAPTAGAATSPPAAPTGTRPSPSQGNAAQGGPTLAGCPVLPADNIWNTPVDSLPLHASSDAYIASIGADKFLHPDFGAGVWPPGSDSPIGIPWVDVPGSQPPVEIIFTDYGDESDDGPYPIPANAPIEGGPNSDGDRHVLVVDQDRCILYELFYAWHKPDGSWDASSGAVFDLSANGPLRPAGWTSADAAGLPILPGLVRYDEVAAGEILHAIRFTAPQTQDIYVWPARHQAGQPGASLPPMGQRFRLKAAYDISGFSPQVQVILIALKKYGMILADNGSPWFLSGEPNESWDNSILDELKTVPGSAFEAVDVSSLMLDPDSGQARSPLVEFSDFFFLPVLFSQ